MLPNIENIFAATGFTAVEVIRLPYWNPGNDWGELYGNPRIHWELFHKVPWVVDTLTRNRFPQARIHKYDSKKP